MGGDIAAAVRHRRNLPARAKARQRAVRRPRAAGVAVVHRHRQAPLQGPDGRRPGLVAFPADLRTAAAGPPPLQPGPVRRVQRAARALRTVRRDQDVTPVLRDLQGDVVQPLVGEQQSRRPFGWRRDPADPRVQPGGPLRPLHGVRPHPRGRIRFQRGEHPGQQLPPPGPHVDQVQLPRVPELRVHPPQQPGHGTRVQRRGVHGGTEVSGRSRSAGAHVETARSVQRGLHRRPPPHRIHAFTLRAHRTKAHTVPWGSVAIVSSRHGDHLARMPETGSYIE